jgi:hypothetical protein
MALMTERFFGKWGLGDIFGEGQWCPVCSGTEFTHIEGHGIVCDGCEAELRLRATAGDAGVVVDCLPRKDGKYIILHPTLIEGQEPQFWQVLKECESGLADRDHWCTNLRLDDLGEGRHLYVHQEDAPLGQELFLYRRYDVARLLARENWRTRTKAGKALAQHTALSPDEFDGDYWEVYRRLRCKCWEYERAHGARIEERLQAAGHEDGYYLHEQCERVLDDCYVVHRCIPKQGEEPVRVDRR